MSKSACTRWWIVGGLGLLVSAAYLGQVYYFRAYINDDAFITFRYSRFLTLGRGPYYNIGEHVEGYTNFLMMMLMAGAIAAFGPDSALLAAKLIGVLSGLLTLVATWALCVRWLRKIDPGSKWISAAAWLAPALVALNAAFALNSMSGLETTLFSGLLLTGLWLTQKARDESGWCGAGIAFAGAALTRPEGVVIFGAVVIGLLLSKAWQTRAERRALIIDTALVAGIVVGHLTFRFVCYDGELLPNTYYAKTGGFAWGVAPGRYLWEFAWYHLGGVACVLALLPLFARHTVVRRAATPGLVVCLAAIMGTFVTGSDWMLGYRLLVPYAPLWAVLSVCGMAAIAGRNGRRILTNTALGCAVLALLIIYLQADTRSDYHHHIRQRAQGYQDGHAALANWLNEHAELGQTVALMDIGIIGYSCPDLRVLDISGLTDRYIAKSPGTFLRKRYDPAYVMDQRPDYIVIVRTQRNMGGAPNDPANFPGWTAAERQLVQSDLFRRHYIQPRRQRSEDGEYARAAAILGAERVFQHRHPLATYLLFLYTYKP